MYKPPLFAQALHHHVNVMQVVPLYCFEPRMVRQTPWSDSKTGPVRTRFLLESVTALRESLQGIGSDLLTAACAPEQAVSGADACQRALLVTFPLNRRDLNVGPVMMCVLMSVVVIWRHSFPLTYTERFLIAELLDVGRLGELIVLTQQEVTSEECAADAAVQVQTDPQSCCNKQAS